MTKKDGDRLRAMQAELVEIAEGYDRSSGLVADLFRIQYAIDLTLKGALFSVTRRPRLPLFDSRDPEIGEDVSRLFGSSATKSPDLPPAA